MHRRCAPRQMASSEPALLASKLLSQRHNLTVAAAAAAASRILSDSDSVAAVHHNHKCHMPRCGGRQPALCTSRGGWERVVRYRDTCSPSCGTGQRRVGGDTTTSGEARGPLLPFPFSAATVSAKRLEAA